MKEANTIKEKIKMIQGTASELNDLQLINKLDIINLKNEIEKLKLSSQPLSPDMQNDIYNMSKILKDMKKTQKTEDIKKLVKKAGKIKALVSKPETITNEIKPKIPNIEDSITKRIEENAENIAKIGLRFKDFDERINEDNIRMEMRRIIDENMDVLIREVSKIIMKELSKSLVE